MIDCNYTLIKNNKLKELIEQDEEIKCRDICVGVLSDTRPVECHIWEEMLGELESYNTDFIVNGGDFTDWSKASEYKLYSDKIKGKRIFNVIGNHDDRLLGSHYFKKYFGDWDFSVDCGMWMCIFMRNTWKFGYGLDRNQIKWLNAKILFAKNKNQKICLFMHAPIKGVFTEWADELGPKLVEDPVAFEAIVKNEIDMVVFGHSHLFAQKKIHNTQFIISGGGAPKLYPCKRIKGQKWSINHSLFIDLKQDGGYVVNMVRRGGEFHEDYTITG